MTARLFAFVIWASVAVCVAFWGLRLGSGTQPVPPYALSVGDAPIASDLSRLLGRETALVATAAVPVSVGTQFKLVGVVAPRAGLGEREGLALISVEGKPAKPFRVGAQVDDTLVLLSVHQRGAALGARGEAPSLNLELPPLPPPTTGTLPAAGTVAAPPPVASPPPAPAVAPPGGGAPPVRLPPVVVPPPEPSPPAAAPAG